MSTIKILSPISNGRTNRIKLRVEDAPNIRYADQTPVNGPYEFYALNSNNIGDVVMHLDLRDSTKSVNPPSADYSDYYMYSSVNAKPGIPLTIGEAGNQENGDSLYNGIGDTLTIKKQSIVNFGNEIGNGFTLSMWVKISNKNPNLDWFRAEAEGGGGALYSYKKAIRSDLVGSISMSNNMIFGIALNMGTEQSRDRESRGNTIFYIRSASGEYSTSFIKNNILNDNWMNLTWVSQIDQSSDKMVNNIYINGLKIQHYVIDEEITSNSTWAALDNGLGFGLWSRTDSDANSEFVSLVDFLLYNSTPDFNSSAVNSHGRFQISTFTLYRKPLDASTVYSDYKFYKDRYITS